MAKELSFFDPHLAISKIKLLEVVVPRGVWSIKAAISDYDDTPLRI